MLVLKDLNVPVEDEELDEVMKFVDTAGQGEINFESFYECT
jgi:Ca2+-binding EF-hand superfamily protein